MQFDLLSATINLSLISVIKIIQVIKDWHSLATYVDLLTSTCINYSNASSHIYDAVAKVSFHRNQPNVGEKFMRLSRTMWEMSLMLNSDCSGLHRSREARIYWCPNFFEQRMEAKECFCDLMQQSFSRWSHCLWSWGFTEEKSTQPHFSSCSPSWITVSWTVWCGTPYNYHGVPNRVRSVVHI